MKIYAWWVVTAISINIGQGQASISTATEFQFSRWRVCFALAKALGKPRPQLFIRTGGHIWGPF